MSALLIDLVVAAGKLLDGGAIDDAIDVGELPGGVAGKLGVQRVASRQTNHRFEVLDGAYVARVHIPRILWHPFLQQPKRTAGETG